MLFILLWCSLWYNYLKKGGGEISKKYDISKSSDMDQFSKDLLNTAMDKTKKQANNQMYDINCPHCDKSVNAPSGKSICPHCAKEINLQLKFDF